MGDALVNAEEVRAIAWQRASREAVGNADLARILAQLPTPAERTSAVSPSPVVLTRLRSSQGELQFLSTFTTFGMPQDITVASLRIEHLMDRKVDRLSGGEMQMVAISRALLGSPGLVLFDEPLTVIDPHLKWQLRRKLKQIHHELKLTLIYVTHDQVEALTFADQVVVMTRGKAVQVGSADALFERPAHTFVGHFIGSPGMNFLPASGEGTGVRVLDRLLPVPGRSLPAGALRLGIRPEYLDLGLDGEAGTLPARVSRVQDIGTSTMLTCEAGGHTLKVRLAAERRAPAVGDTVHLRLIDTHTCFYQDERLIP